MKFEFTQEEAQIILNCLQEQPYKIVVGVINNLQAQAIEQMQPKQQAFNVSVPASDKAV